MLIGMGQFSTDSSDFGVSLNTSAVAVSTPTSAQTDQSLLAIAQSQCVDQPGAIWDPSTGSCSGDGSGSYTPVGANGCPAGTVLSGGYCVAPAAAPTTGSAAVCAAGSTCSIVPGISNSKIYLALATVAVLFMGVSTLGGRR